MRKTKFQVIFEEIKPGAAASTLWFGSKRKCESSLHTGENPACSMVLGISIIWTKGRNKFPSKDWDCYTRTESWGVLGVFLAAILLRGFDPGEGILSGNLGKFIPRNQIIISGMNLVKSVKKHGVSVWGKTQTLWI